MSPHCVCPEGHTWTPDAAATLQDSVSCPFCGKPGRREADNDSRTLAPAFLDELPPGPRASIRIPPTQLSRAGTPAHSPASRSLPVVPGYELLAELGRGGMGVVYRARQKNLNRVVALKMILAGGDASLEELSRFRTEAEAAAQLQHPHIVQVYEIGELGSDSGTRRPYMAMELIEGISLSDHLHGKPLLPRDAAAVALTLARAIHFAHERGIVHRDLKPGNVLLGDLPSVVGDRPDKLASFEKGARVDSPKAESREQKTESRSPTAVKITDFGLAKRLETEGGGTRTGSILGTPSYMAPEQARGLNEAIGPPADIYALGAILYEMLTGHPPFCGATAVETLQQVISEEPISPVRAQPRVPRDLETITLKCLQKEPARRYVTADALAEDLRRFLAGEAIEARPIGPFERSVRWARRNPRVAALAAMLGIAIIVGFVAVSLEWRRAEEERTHADRNYRLYRRILMDAFASLSTEVESDHEAALPLKEELLQSVVGHLETLARLDPDDHEIQADLAVGYFCLAKIMAITRRWDEALAKYQQASALDEGVVAKHPEVVRYRIELARCYHGVGGVILSRDGVRSEERWQSAEDALRKGLAIRQQLIAEGSQDYELRRDLGRSHQALGFLPHMRGGGRVATESQKGLPELHRAIEMRRELWAERPDDEDCRAELAGALNDLALVYAGCKEHEKSLSAFEESIALQPASAAARQKLKHRHGISVQYFNMGKALLELDRPLDAVEAARKARRAIPDDRSNLWRQARIMAEAAARIARERPSDGSAPDRLVEEAMDMLRDAVDAGLDDPAALDYGEFRSLAGRPDFVKLMQRVKAVQQRK